MGALKALATASNRETVFRTTGIDDLVVKAVTFHAAHGCGTTAARQTPLALQLHLGVSIRKRPQDMVFASRETSVFVQEITPSYGNAI